MVKRLLWAFLGGFVAVLVFLANTSSKLSLGLETELIEKYEALKAIVNGERSQNIAHDVLMIDITYDRQLTDVYDDIGMPIGNTDLTDRYKLFELLKYLHDNVSYRFVVLDVELSERGPRTEIDDSLCNVICSMNNILIPYPTNGNSLERRIEQKSASAYYIANLWNDKCSKYSLYNDNKPTIAMKMYQEMTESEFKSFLGIAWTKDGLLPSALPVSLIYAVYGPYWSDGQKTYYRLGADILDSGDISNIKEMANNKLVLIGDFEERDMHDTYIGSQPGILIHYNAFKALEDHRAFLGYFFLFCLWLFCFIISVFQLNDISLASIISRLMRVKSSIWKTILLWVDYVIILNVFCILAYIFTHNIFEVLSLSFYFPLQTKFFELCKRKQLL